jgi:hypothetical protein
MGSHFRRWLAGIAMLVACAGTAHAQTAIGLDFALYFDGISSEDDERIGALHEITRADLGNVYPFAGAIYFLYHLGSDDKPLDGFRVGGELRYLGQYATERDEGERDKQVMGTLLELGFRGDWSTELVSRFALAFGLRLDLALLLPGGDFADEIERLADEGVPTSDGPRVGLALIPSFGVRYQIHERVNARLDVGLGWSYLDLFDVDAGVQGIQYQRDASFSTTRVEISVGVEFAL